MKKKISKRSGFFGNSWKIFYKALYKSILVFIFLTLTPVIIYKYLPPKVTPLMIIRAFEKKMEGKTAKIDYKWVPLSKISGNLVTAAVTSEDNQFLEHFGFDVDAINKALENNKKKNKPVRGGSTISQQTAKNLFLWPNRSWIRKGMETYFTFLIELFWSKERIMEVYLNIIEMGDGIYGAGVASEFYFKKKPDKLSREEAALIIATLPNPLKYSIANPSSYINKRQQIILKRMIQTGDIKFTDK
jgi:monofunctional biosynthetic peptidoglycan transglycosylase